MPITLFQRLNLKFELEDNAKVATITNIISNVIKGEEWKKAMHQNIYFKMITIWLKVNNV